MAFLDLFSLSRLKREAARAKSRAETAIADFMRPHSILTFGGNEIATWKNQDHTSLDQKLLAEELPEVTARYKRTKEIRVLRLKKLKHA